MSFLDDKEVLVTGGTGSFGKRFVRDRLERHSPKQVVVVFSRDELKQFEMRRQLGDRRGALLHRRRARPRRG